MYFVNYKHHARASRVALVLKNPPANARDVRDVGLIPGLKRSPGEEKGYLLQYSTLESSMDYTVHGVSESDATEQFSPSLHFQQLLVM